MPQAGTGRPSELQINKKKIKLRGNNNPRHVMELINMKMKHPDLAFNDMPGR